MGTKTKASKKTPLGFSIILLIKLKRIHLNLNKFLLQQGLLMLASVRKNSRLCSVANVKTCYFIYQQRTNFEWLPYIYKNTKAKLIIVFFLIKSHFILDRLSQSVRKQKNRLILFFLLTKAQKCNKETLFVYLFFFL